MYSHDTHDVKLRLDGGKLIQLDAHKRASKCRSYNCHDILKSDSLSIDYNTFSNTTFKLLTNEHRLRYIDACAYCFKAGAPRADDVN